MPDRVQALEKQVASLVEQLQAVQARFERLNIGGSGQAGLVGVMDGGRVPKASITMSGNAEKTTGAAIVPVEEIVGDAALLRVDGAIIAGGPERAGVVRVLRDDAPAGPRATIRLDGKEGTVQAGGNKVDGRVTVQTNDGKAGVQLGAGYPFGQEAGALGFLDVGAGQEGVAGQLTVAGPGGVGVLLSGAAGTIQAGGNQVDGHVVVQNAEGQRTVQLDGSEGAIRAGGNGVSGGIQVNNDEGRRNIGLYGSGWGGSALVSIGDSGQPGALLINNDTGDVAIRMSASGLASEGARILVGRAGLAGTIILLDGSKEGIRLNGLDRSIRVEDILIDGQNQRVLVHDRQGKPSIELNGNDGDIILQNADCAEEFDLAEDAPATEPGTVMVLDDDAKLRQSAGAYDRRVAGVISGAGDYKPGIVLDRRHPGTGRRPIALVGKVYCKVDADHGAIQVGDLLTTSPTPGHAMRAGDAPRAFGAVLGKALRPLAAGRGLIPVLVALQ